MLHRSSWMKLPAHPERRREQWTRTGQPTTTSYGPAWILYRAEGSHEAVPAIKLRVSLSSALRRNSSPASAIAPLYPSAGVSVPGRQNHPAPGRTGALDICRPRIPHDYLSRNRTACAHSSRVSLARHTKAGKRTSFLQRMCHWNAKTPFREGLERSDLSQASEFDFQFLGCGNGVWFQAHRYCAACRAGPRSGLWNPQGSARRLTRGYAPIAGLRLPRSWTSDKRRMGYVRDVIYLGGDAL
jgi:hypothetical protein